MSRVAGGHHVFSIKHLLCQFGDCKISVPLAIPGGEWGEPGHEEVESGEGHHVDCQFAEVSIELAWEAEAGGDAGHGGTDQVVEVTVGGRGKTQSVEADVIEGFVVDDVRLIGVLHEQVDGEGAVVGFHHCVGHLW